jgi:hypothetical protein
MGVLAVVIWAGAVASGFAILLRYKTTPGASATAPARWPPGSRLGPSSGGATLVMFAHPRCPCTHASVSELARLLARVPRQPRAYVVLAHPAGTPDDWEDTELARRAASIPGVVLGSDESGSEAARFGARVSGFTVLYDAAGRLLFAGGITQSRGHEGESFGARRILAALQGVSADRPDAPVFGCALSGGPAGPQAASNQEGS